MSWLALFLLIAAVMVAVSYIVETLRTPPPDPPAPGWLPEGAEYGFAEIDGRRVRRLRAGRGRPVVLLHTLRTQLDLFKDVIPDLARDFEVHAFDFPAHGYSEIAAGAYGPERFLDATRAYLDWANVENAVIVGESIGGAIGLLLAAEAHPRVAKVVAVNSYDYDRGQGILRGSTLSWLIFTLTRVPVLGAMVWRMRWLGIFALMIRASVHDPARLDDALVREMHDVGNRPGHYRAFIALILDFPKWERLRRRYPKIKRPVDLVYGAHDWSRRAERDGNRTLIPGATLTEIESSGHLMSFDAPEAVIRAARRAAED
ncbi:MAG: alpha/beta hydrolase [Paracoccaceae bacterium]